MKKLFTFFLALTMSIAVSAQCSLTEAVDFTTTDHHGNEIHLFDILDGGQYVLIDFFFTTCGPCQNSTPNVVDAYYALGCNQHDVFFMEVSPSDHNNEPYLFIDNWINTYGIEYPTIYLTSGGPDTGEDICNMYQIPAYPTIILISPDRQIVVQDIWPVSSAQTIIDALAPFGIEEHECDGEVQNPDVIIDVETEASYSLDIKFTPNAATASYYVLCSENAELEAGDILLDGVQLTNGGVHTFSGLNAETVYTIYAMPVSTDGIMGNLKTATATTLCPGGEGVSTIEFAIEVGEAFVIVDAMPNGETSEYHYAMGKVSAFEEMGEDYVIDGLLHDGNAVCGNDFWQVPVEAIEAGIPYYVFGIGLNGNAEVGELSKLEFTLGEGVIEVTSASYSIFPNPATSTINIRSIANIEAEVNIYDMTGRCVKNVVVSDMSNATINVEDLNQGVYFMNINGVIEKLVIE